MIEDLLRKYPLISDQVSKDQLRVILTELEKVLPLDGAVVEFGCYIGTTSLFIRRLLDAHQNLHTKLADRSVMRVNTDEREFHVYDSFEGLPPKSREDTSPAGTQFQAGELAVSKKLFLREFQRANLKPPTIHKGWFKDLTERGMPEKVSFAFLDGDFYESIRDSLRLVLPRTAKGGTIIVDDYAREALPGAARAVHELLPRATVQTAYNLAVIHL